MNRDNNRDKIFKLCGLTPKPLNEAVEQELPTSSPESDVMKGGNADENSVIDFKPYGGYELFLKEDESFYNECIQKIPFINDIIKPLFKTDVFSKEVDRFNFGGIFENLIFNPFEAQIDTGNMMQALLKKAQQNDILILNSQTVMNFQEVNDGVEVETNGRQIPWYNSSLLVDYSFR